MAKLKEVSFKVLNEQNEELREITVSVKGGKEWQERAEQEAVKQLQAGEHLQLITPASADQDKEEGTKFTFEFEIYQNGVQKRVVDLSALNEDEGAALEAVIAKLKEELSEDESYRYTGKFKKQTKEK
jgi:uncharacterized protein YdaT